MKKFLVLALFILSLTHGAAHAYIDPNTTHTVFSALAWILAGLGMILNLLFWPILFFRKKITAWFHTLSTVWKVFLLFVACLFILILSLLAYKIIF